MGAGMGAEMGTTKERSAGEGEPENLRSDTRGGIGRTTRERRRRQLVTSSHSRKTRGSKDRRVMRRARVEGREARDKIGEGGGGVKKLKKLQKSCRRDVKSEEDLLSGRRKKRRLESVGSVDVDSGHVHDRKEVERGAQDAQGLSKNCREIIFPFSRPIRGFRDKYH